MSYNLKKQNTVLFAFAFIAMLTMNNPGFAEENKVPENIQDQTTEDADMLDDDLFGLNEPEVNEETSAADSEQQASSDTGENTVADEAPKDDAFPQATEQEETTDDDLDLPEQQNEEKPAESDVSAENTPAPAENAADTEENAPATQENPDAVAEEAIPLTEAPKSPFEKFGNSILSKVDNSLFNQMSEIEKQTTILNLEFKREEIKNRIEALKMQRLKAQQEEEARRKAEEQRIKEQEAERQIRIAEAEEKLKQQEIELEKVRQARVLNEYMNEMLVMNQKWIEKNAELQKQIQDLRVERKNLISDFESKLADIQKANAVNIKKAETAKTTHERVVASFTQQIGTLRKTLSDNEALIQQMKSGGNSANPFGEGSDIDENAVDMSDEYAIMDITGKGNNIVAKIVSKDGTTFIVHKGSMLKGGEVVTAITDNYVAFNNKGVKSYLYTGGTVREYEPAVSFNDADKTPEVARGVRNNTVIRNVRGVGNTNTQAKKTRSSAVVKDTSESSSSSSSKGQNSGAVSLGQGMFMR